ncbi:MAG TPA: Hsp20/alpha crystallin family protein [Lachnospiraceae bacterium]|nr:Hsp20/alpha crystallin family protein [Lachnospiraceae bacterium]
MLAPALFESSKPLFMDNFFDKAFENFFSDTGFSENFHTDLIERDGEYVLEAELPGFNKEDINIDLNKDILTVSASHSEESEEKKGKNKYIRRERRYQSYQRSFRVPNVSPEDIDASYEKGILELKFPKKDPAEPEVKRIEVK